MLMRGAAMMIMVAAMNVIMMPAAGIRATGMCKSRCRQEHQEHQHNGQQTLHCADSSEDIALASLIWRLLTWISVQTAMAIFTPQ